MVNRVNKIEDLRIWQCARTISKDIYTYTRRENFEKDFRFVQQIRAAAGSIMDNIAEGYGRGGTKEFIQFLYISRGSCQELISQIYRAWDIQYISEDEFTDIKKRLDNLSVMIYNFIESLNKIESKGPKYLQQ
ncbi:MAG: four helix bundle protein [Paludibacteraceae bacterium]|nr:four helix bundle protein [Paludibacteraceae bacterium]